MLSRISIAVVSLFSVTTLWVIAGTTAMIGAEKYIGKVMCPALPFNCLLLPSGLIHRYAFIGRADHNKKMFGLHLTGLFCIAMGD